MGGACGGTLYQDIDLTHGFRSVCSALPVIAREMLHTRAERKHYSNRRRRSVVSVTRSISSQIKPANQVVVIQLFC
jgi:CRISPR-associated DxTHG motif protein